MDDEPRSMELLLMVTEILESLDIPYLIGGSVASMFHGVVRTTADVDIVADLRVEQIEPFVDRVPKDFYFDSEVILEAIRHRSSFNLVHYDSTLKIDVFIPKERPFSQSQLKRRIKGRLMRNIDRKVFFASPEDTILAKLEWYEMGHHVSDRQWRDIIGVLKVQGDTLDFRYLRHWAAELKVSDLLEKALTESEA